MPEQRVVYQALNHQSDAGFVVTAPSWQRLYIDAGLALSDLLVKQELVKAELTQKIKVEAAERQDLLTCWLQEILALFQAQRFVVRRIVFEKFDGKQILATLWGETYVPTRHGVASEISRFAPTPVQIGETAGGESLFFARVIFQEIGSSPTKKRIAR